MALLPTYAHLLQHMLRAHLQIMMWKAAHCEGTAGESRDITNFGRKFPIKIYKPVIAEGDPAPPELNDVIQSKKCCTEVDGCHKQHPILQLSWWTGLLESIHCN